jgi:hypothetical protein
METTKPLALPSWFSLNPAAGAAVWLIFVAAVQPGLAPALLVLAPLVLFPIGFSILERIERPESIPMWQAIRLLQFPAALVLPTAFLLPPGVGSAILALPWVVITVLLACYGAVRWKRAPISAVHVGTTAALVFPIVGGAWLVASRLGMRPLDLTDAIVQATAVHFHYAGFALPMIAALVARQRPGRWASAGVAGVVLGVPLVAAGITLTAFGFRFLEGPAAWLLTATCLLIAVLQATRGQMPGDYLCGISSSATFAAMMLASIYALGNFLGTPWLDIPTMVWTHGALNAIGFSLCGLLGWRARVG